jgi:hemerythrin superfamily protein
MANIFKQLSQEHEEVRELLQALAREIDPTLFDELRRNLLAHAKAEESEFYSYVRSLDDEVSTKIDDAFQEHQEVEKLLQKMQKAVGDDAKFAELLEELTENVEHHVEEEEGEIFPMVEQHMSEEELVEMRDNYLETKKGIMESIQPLDGTDRYAAMTKEELYEEAKELDIQGRSQMNRDELEEELRKKGS